MRKIVESMTIVSTIKKQLNNQEENNQDAIIKSITTYENFFSITIVLENSW